MSTMRWKRRNPVREVILRKLDEYRTVIIDGKLEEITNLEALVDVIFERAIDGRDKRFVQLARMLFEYGVGRPGVQKELDDEVPTEKMTREQVEAEILEAEKLLGVEIERPQVYVRPDESVKIEVYREGF